MILAQIICTWAQIKCHYKVKKLNSIKSFKTLISSLPLWSLKDLFFYEKSQKDRCPEKDRFPNKKMPGFEQESVEYYLSKAKKMREEKK